MKKLHALPHRICESTCYVNGLEDILAWKGSEYTDYLLSVVGGMASFTYLHFKRADPPCMVYWGANTKYLMKDLANVIDFKETVVEGKAFKSMFSILKKAIDNGKPVVAGALDMYHLHYYPELYRKQHIPIHYILAIGYDDEEQVVYAHDCSHRGVQKIPYTDFEESLDVKVPGMSKKNTIRTFVLPEKLPTELEVARKGFSYKAEKFLNPPVKLFGVPAMRRLAEEIFEWDNKKCFEHMATYATTPPMLPKTFENSHGMRFWQADVLNTLGRKYGIDEWVEASTLFRRSGEEIIDLSKASLEQDRQQISEDLTKIADIEEKAYESLKQD